MRMKTFLHVSASILICLVGTIAYFPLQANSRYEMESIRSQIQGIESHVFGQRFQFESQILKETKDVFVYLPESYKEISNRFIVMYVLDGRSYFEPFAGMVKYLSLYETIPEMIVVGVASGDRIKEFTDTEADEATGDWPTSGQAKTFREFLSDELIPSIEASYRTHPYRIIVGHSLAGLFAVESMLRKPLLFQTTIALSPSLYWNQFEWLKKAERFLGGQESLKHHLFISGEQKGEEETGLLAGFKEAATKGAPPDFKYDYRCFPEEDHGTVAFPGLYCNLKKLFQGWSFPGEAWQSGPDKVVEHFDALSERFGFSVSITEEFLNDHALHGLRRHVAPDEAIKLFELCLSLYPNSSHACEGLGEAYEKKGSKDKAIEFYQKALELDPSSAIAKNRLKELKK